MKDCWCIAPKRNADFVCAMEDVLEVYRRDFAEDEVLVCMDETGKQHVKETRTPVPTRPGETAKYDYEYERNGVSNLFMLCAPLEGWRHVKATDRRTKVDWARLIEELVDEHYSGKRTSLFQARRFAGCICPRRRGLLRTSYRGPGSLRSSNLSMEWDSGPFLGLEGLS